MANEILNNEEVVTENVTTNEEVESSDTTMEMMMTPRTHKVYIKTDSNDSIIAVNSSDFLSDTTGWIEIDEGLGDKYHHAQGNYFEKSLVDNNGLYNYKYIDDTVTERTDSEKRLSNIDNVLASKIQHIKQACEKTIVAGTDADVLGRGMLHYSLTETKQDDIKTLALNIQNGAAGAFWHDDSRLMHEFYTAEQFNQLYQILYAFIITCKITSDGLEQYAADCAANKDIDTLDSITWGTELPEYIQIQVDQQIALMLGTTTEQTETEVTEETIDDTTDTEGEESTTEPTETEESTETETTE